MKHKKPSESKGCWVVYFRNGTKKVVGKGGSAKGHFGTKQFRNGTRAKTYAEARKTEWDNHYYLRTHYPDLVPKDKPSTWGTTYKVHKPKR